jgi:hypothetical protein
MLAAMIPGRLAETVVIVPWDAGTFTVKVGPGAPLPPLLGA